MKKIISIAFAAILAGLAISCQKEELVSEKTDAVQYTFNITVNDQVGFDNDASTKGGSSATYKSAWDNGDKIFLFFKPTSESLLTDTYATLTYNGSSWVGTVTEGQSSLGNGGTLSAVFVYKLGSSTPSYSDNKWTIATGNTFYNCQTGGSYTVSGNNEISATLNLVAPADFVQFYVGSATGVLTCDKVKGWKDVAIGSDMTVSNVTCTGYMEGFTNGGDSNVKEYYGRIVSGTSLKNVDCEFSVVKNGEVYERTAIPSSDARSFSMNTSATGDKAWTKAVGKLPGLFTVDKGADNTAGTADDEMVRFSQGNLYYDGSKFGFEDEQYYFRTYNGKGKCDKNGYSAMSGTTNGHWGLFGWVGASSTTFTTSPEIYGVSTSTTSSDYGNTSGETLKADWGTAIDNKGTWTTLTGGDNGEWKYLFDNHVNVYGNCNNVPGCFIAPDDYKGDADALSTAVNDWASAQTAGIVFLPAAGGRSGSAAVPVAFGGNYWSSSAYDGGNAYSVNFTSNHVYPDFHDFRHYGLFVRLITKSK